MPTLLRWFLVPVAGVAAWFGALLTTTGLDWLYWQFDYPCPKERLLSAGCPNTRLDWYSVYADVMLCVGASLAAIYVVTGCTLAAPSHKKWVALAAYGVGALVAGFMGRSLGEYVPLIAALVAGGIAAILMSRRYTIAHAA